MPRIAYVFFAFLLVTFAAAVTSSCSGGATTTQRAPLTDPAAYTTGVIHDPETGCEYIVTSSQSNAGITPRLTAGGKPICRPHN